MDIDSPVVIVTVVTVTSGGVLPELSVDMPVSACSVQGVASSLDDAGNSVVPSAVLWDA